ncbi:MAG: hypothetical protein JO243_02890, partial [Solirubrobacterales bacterium]|nr:hypothetical protein [Solirubrobacterales bacterium]
MRTRRCRIREVIQAASSAEIIFIRAHSEPPMGGTMAAKRTSATPAGSKHPLDPLSAEEIRQVAAIMRRDQGVGSGWRFGMIELHEPAKAVVRSFSPGDRVAREADVVCWRRGDGHTFKGRVSIAEDRIVAWEHRPGEQANFTNDEFQACGEALKQDPRVIAALERRGIRDISRVLVDTWAYGGLLVPERHRDRRVGWT